MRRVMISADRKVAEQPVEARRGAGAYARRQARRAAARKAFELDERVETASVERRGARAAHERNRAHSLTWTCWTRCRRIANQAPTKRSDPYITAGVAACSLNAVRSAFDDHARRLAELLGEPPRQRQPRYERGRRKVEAGDAFHNQA